MTSKPNQNRRRTRRTLCISIKQKAGRKPDVCAFIDGKDAFILRYVISGVVLPILLHRNENPDHRPTDTELKTAVNAHFLKACAHLRFINVLRRAPAPLTKDEVVTTTAKGQPASYDDPLHRARHEAIFSAASFRSNVTDAHGELQKKYRGGTSVTGNQDRLLVKDALKKRRRWLVGKAVAEIKLMLNGSENAQIRLVALQTAFQIDAAEIAMRLVNPRRELQDGISKMIGRAWSTLPLDNLRKALK